jgi:L-amino acid N-acyltransferase YncA
MAGRQRRAEPEDAEAIALIYNQGIEDRLATFEVTPRMTGDVARWFDDGYPIIVVEDEASVVAWASATPYRAREAYRGVAEFSVYVDRTRRGEGFGRAALSALIAESESRGYWKLLSRVFVQNEASRRLCASLGFREVGIYRRHAKLDGRWMDCVIVEKLLGEASREPAGSI